MSWKFVEKVETEGTRSLLCRAYRTQAQVCTISKKKLPLPKRLKSTSVLDDQRSDVVIAVKYLSRSVSICWIERSLVVIGRASGCRTWGENSHQLLYTDRLISLTDCTRLKSCVANVGIG